MKRLLLVLLILWASTSHAINRDSLMRIWNNKSLHDTIRLIALDKIVLSHVDNEPDSAISLSKMELELAIRKNYPEYQAWAYNRQGIAFKNKENHIRAINLFLTSLELSQKIGLKKCTGVCYVNMGLVYVYQGIYSKALEYYLKGLTIFQEIKYIKGEISAYANIGSLYYYIGEYSKGSEYQFKALKLTNPGDKYTLARCYSNIGNNYSCLGDDNKAIEFYNKAKKIFEEVGDKEGIGAYYEYIGNFNVKKGDYKNAMDNFVESLKIREEINNKLDMAYSSINIGCLYIVLKNFNQAITWCQKAQDLNRETGALIVEESACNCLYEAYKGLGNNAKALMYYEQFMKAGDSLKKNETTKKLQQMEFQKQLLADSMKQAEITLKTEMAHKEQMNRQRIQKVILFSVIAVVLVMIFGIWRRLRYTRKTKVVIEKEKDRSENLLLNILPSEVAEELKQTGHCQAKTFSMVTVMFADFKDFTSVSEKISAELLVDEINFCFSAFDRILPKYKVEKIKTVGDAYICVSGMPVLSHTHAFDMVNAAIEIRNFMLTRKQEKEVKGEIPFELRIGIHTGPVVAGIVGVKKFQYDIWGDTVNLAARMESSGEAGQVNISGATYALVKDKFTCTHRGKIVAKNKGEIDMYFVNNKSESLPGIVSLQH